MLPPIVLFFIALDSFFAKYAKAWYKLEHATLRSVKTLNILSRANNPRIDEYIIRMKSRACGRYTLAIAKASMHFRRAVLAVEGDQYVKEWILQVETNRDAYLHMAALMCASYKIRAYSIKSRFNFPSWFHALGCALSIEKVLEHSTQETHEINLQAMIALFVLVERHPSISLSPEDKTACKDLCFLKQTLSRYKSTI